MLLAYTVIGREHKRMSEEIQRLGEKNARLEDELKVSQSKTENMKGHRDSILEDYSVQSATLTTMTDRAVIAECRLAETMNELETETENVAKVTRYSQLCESSKEFLLVKLEGYDKCRAEAKLYKCDAERYKRDSERYKRGAQHYAKKACVAEEDCSANLFTFHEQKKALEEEVKALKAKDQAGRLEDANIKKIKVLELKIQGLEMNVENLKDSEETTKAAYEMEIKGDKATINDLRTKLEYTKEELDGYKEDNDERSQTIKGLLGLRKQQQKELEDVKRQLALAHMAIKTMRSELGYDDGDDAASPSDPPSGADPSGAGQPGPSDLPSASGTAQVPGTAPDTAPGTASDTASASNAAPNAAPDAASGTASNTASAPDAAPDAAPGTAQAPGKTSNCFGDAPPLPTPPSECPQS